MTAATHRQHRAAGVLAALCVALAASAAMAQDSEGIVELDDAPVVDEDDPLSRAQAAYTEVEFDETLRFAREALDRGGYSPAQMARLFELVGMAAAALDRADLAREAFTRLLAIDPGYELADGVSPRVEEPFLEARGTWSTHPERLGAEVTFARARGALRVDVVDPLAMARTVRVIARLEGEVEFTERREPASAQVYVEVAGSRDAPGVEFVVQLLDRHDNVVFALGDEDDPEVIGRPAAPAAASGQGEVDEAPARDRRWVWAVVGVSAGVVAVGVVVAAVVLGLQAGEIGVETSVDFGLGN